MAIRVGQIRKEVGKEYITGIPHSLTTYTNSGVGNVNFQDFAIQANFIANTTYYVRVLINRIDINANMGDTSGAGDNDPHNQNIDIRLYESVASTSKYQTIDEPILVQPYFNENSSTIEDEDKFMQWCEDSILEGNPSIYDYDGASDYYTILKTNYEARRGNNDGKQSGIRTPTQTVELVFSPFKTSQLLVFQLRRVAYDYTVNPRIVTIDSDNLSRDVAVVNNILPRNSINKVGIQTRSGSLITINKEPMRIGKSGTLEINNGINITSVGIIAPLNNINDFILDYTYNS